MAVVLVVEDDVQVRVLTESFLESTGHKALSAGTIEEALALFKTGAPIDVLFTDLGLHDDVMAGVTLAREAMALRPDLKVLYTTGQGVTDGMKALFVEHSACLPKPYTVEQLEATLALHFNIKHPAKQASTP